jgi:hypothetical protein
MCDPQSKDLLGIVLASHKRRGRCQGSKGQRSDDGELHFVKEIGGTLV